MRKTIIAVGLAVVLGSGLSATASAKDSFTIGLSNGWVGSEWRTQMIDEAEAAAKAWEKKGIKVKTIAQSANVDVPGQIAQVRNFINQGVDAIIVNPNSPTALIRSSRRRRPRASWSFRPTLKSPRRTPSTSASTRKAGRCNRPSGWRRR